MKIKTLLVDDEFLALNLLENFIHRLPNFEDNFEIIEKAKSPIRALEILQTQSVDLLFLDIQMPTLSGTNLLKNLPNPPLTIFTTAYSEHAPLAFDLNAVDYLLKPFSFERFVQAIQKAQQQLQLKKANVEPTESNKNPDFISVKVDGNMQKIFLDEILFVEGLREYVRIICENKKKYITLESLKNMELMLPPSDFMRVHKSYIIAKSKVTKLVGNTLEIKEYQIPTSRGKKEEIVNEVFGK